jgi:hypothetical protein
MRLLIAYALLQDSDFASRLESFLELCRASSDPYAYTVEAILRFKATMEKSRLKDPIPNLLDQK